MKKDLNNINNFEKALDASGRGLTAEKKKYFFMISLMVASAIAWFIQYMIALLLFIIITLPLLI